MTRILVTNDDGVDARGIHVLTAALARAGHDVVVVAPDRDRSGAGAALGGLAADEHLDAQRVELPGCAGVPAFALDATPGLCVIAARLGAFGDPPDVVVSGINPGPNTGRSVLHSGTVGAALTGQGFGCSGLAVSLGVSDPWHYDTAARVALDVLPMVLDAPARSVLNLNVPGVGYDDLRGIRWARLAPFGTVRSALAERDDGKLQFELRATDAVFPPDSDSGLLRDGFASLTTLVGVAEAWPEGPGAPAGGIEANVVPGGAVEPAHPVPDASAPRSLHRPSHGGAVPGA